METIRVALNDTFLQTYTLVSPSGSVIDLTGATIEVAVLDVDTGEELTTIECTLVSPTTTGIVSFSVEDVASEKGIYKIQFRMTNTDGTVTTYPSEGEQALLVY